MDLEGKTILILGGSGLVGRAIARRMLDFRPGRIALVALYEDEAREAAESLESARGGTIVDYAWGNVFVPTEAATSSRAAVMQDARMPRQVGGDVLDGVEPDRLEGGGRASVSRIEIVWIWIACGAAAGGVEHLYAVGIANEGGCFLAPGGCLGADDWEPPDRDMKYCKTLGTCPATERRPR